jgi:hypothetical protein
LSPTEPSHPAPCAGPCAAPAVARFSGADAVAFVDQARSLGVETRATELVSQNKPRRNRRRSRPQRAASGCRRSAARRNRAGSRRRRHHPRRRRNDPRRDRRFAIVARALRAADVPEASRQYGLSPAGNRGGACRHRHAPRARPDDVILRAANTTSDFPKLLEAAANKILLARYDDRRADLSDDRQARDLTDFKTTKLLRVGDFPTLLAYQEDGKIQAGTINEGRETVILGSYGRILRLSRQAIVNDDLGAFDRRLRVDRPDRRAVRKRDGFAAKAANSGNGPKLADNVNFFNAAHGNLAGSGTAIDVAEPRRWSRGDAQAEGSGRQRAEHRARHHADRP